MTSRSGVSRNSEGSLELAYDMRLCWYQIKIRSRLRKVIARVLYISYENKGAIIMHVQYLMYLTLCHDGEYKLIQSIVHVFTVSPPPTALRAVANNGLTYSIEGDQPGDTTIDDSSS